MKFTKFLLGILWIIPMGLSAQNVPVLNSNLNGITPTNQIALPAPFVNLTKFNYVRTWEPQSPITDQGQLTEHTPTLVSKMHTMYTDGFGSQVQQIIRNYGDVSDLIRTYDNRAKADFIDFLPYPSMLGSKFQSSPFLAQKSYYDVRFPMEAPFAYSLNKYISTPDFRKVKGCDPGKSFVGQDIGGETFNKLNQANELELLEINSATSLPEKKGFYPLNSLAKKINNNEHGARVEEFYDDKNRLLCKSIFSGYEQVNGQSAATWNSTYFIYDDFGRLVYTLSPKAAKILKANNWNFTPAILQNLTDYSVYDTLDRIVETHVAGKTGNTFTVYDIKNRVVMTQSPKLRQLGKWAFNLYDGQNRVKMSGLMESSRGRDYWQSLMNQNGIVVNNTPNHFEYYGVYHNDAASYPQSLIGCVIDNFIYYDTYSAPFFNGHQYDQSLFTGNLSSHFTAIAPFKTDRTKGFVTGTKSRLLKPALGAFSNMGDWISTINYYDDYGRVIQKEVQHQLSQSGIWDMTGYQYNFSGAILREIAKHNNPIATNKPSTIYIKEFSYNPRNFKAQSVSMSLDNGTSRALTSVAYDDLGRIKNKTVGGIETQIYEYNIRGQLSAINSAHTLGQATNYNTTFGEVLYYDYGFSNKRFDGNISGMIWRGPGHTAMKAYGYNYDYTGKLSDGIFHQYNPQTNNWKNNENNYSEYGITYDENGNLKTLNRMAKTSAVYGFPAPYLVDQLNYTYESNDASNRLLRVDDQVLNPSLTDYDLKDIANAVDYEYDDEGNCIADHNRKIRTSYSYINRPEVLEFDNGDKIYYAYDLAGNKISEYYDLGSKKYKLDYIGNFVYRNDSLQHVLHNEGIARRTGNTYNFQYFIKDHAGNVRNVLEAVETPLTREYMASHELASANSEQLVFDHIPEVREDKPDNNGPEDLKSAMLVGADPQKRIGTSVLLHVMSGDKFKLSAQSYFEGDYNSDDVVEPQDMLGSIVSTLVGGNGSIGGGDGSGSAELIDQLFSPHNFIDAYNAVKENAYDPNAPKAFLNYIAFDEDMQIVPELSGAVQVSQAAGEWKVIGTPSELEMDRSGYLAVYISSEARSLNVYFDNISITHYKGNLVDENHYYPYGLTINLSTANPLENRYLFLGNKLEKINNLHIYDFNARQYDPQSARFLSIDPLKEYYSGYAYSAGDPVSISDKTGLKGKSSVWGSYGSGAPSAASNMLWNQTGRYYSNGSFEVDPDFKRGVDKGYQKLLGHTAVTLGSIALGGLTSGEAAFVAAEGRAAAAARASAWRGGKEAAAGGLSRGIGSRAIAQRSSSTFVRGAAEEVTPLMGRMAMESSGTEVVAAPRFNIQRTSVADPAATRFTTSLEANISRIEFQSIGSSGPRSWNNAITRTGVSGEATALSSIERPALPMQIHHFATNKHSTFTPQMEQIAQKFGLELDQAWNKMAMPHQGRHPTKYHSFVLREMTNAAAQAAGSQIKFLQYFETHIKQPVINNPLLLRKAGW